MPQVSVELSENLKKRLESYADSNEISQRGVIRMFLNQHLPEQEVGDETQR